MQTLWGQVKPLELKSKELEKDSDWTYYSFSKMPHLTSHPRGFFFSRA